MAQAAQGVLSFPASLISERGWGLTGAKPGLWLPSPPILAANLATTLKTWENPPTRIGAHGNGGCWGADPTAAQNCDVVARRCAPQLSKRQFPPDGSGRIG